MAESLNLQRFGRYLILDHLVDGGMAKICRARFLGEQADKVVVIKMIQPQFSQDPNFRKMFMDEIKVAFGLIHPNIAQTYDYGMINDQLYTAMEYVDGANLKQFIDRLKSKNYVFPVQISIHIISQVCQGLAYAHNFTDKLTGKATNIIHRDISPHNIMISYDGAIKIIDFGIAKAETNSESTKAGTIKGKLSYLAPEYLEGVELDHRYDQFAVGITLWELLCCRKLFQANNELAVLKLIQTCKVPPPSTINPNVPKELDEIVMKSLSKDRENRFKDMDQFNRALVKTLYSQYPDFNPLDLSQFAKELYKDEIKADKAKLIEFGKIDVSKFLKDYKSETGPQNSNAGQTQVHVVVQQQGPEKTDKVTGVVAREAARKEIDLGISDIPKSKLRKDGTIVMDSAQKSGLEAPQRSGLGHAKTMVMNSGVKDLGTKFIKDVVNKAQTGKSGNGLSLESKKTTPQNRQVRENRSMEVSTVLSQKKAPTSIVIMAFVAMIGIIFYFQKDSIMQIVDDLLGVNRHPASSVGLNNEAQSAQGNTQERVNQVAPQEEHGLIQLKGLDLLMEIFINNKKVEYSGVGLKVPLNQPVQLTIRKNGFNDFTKAIQLGPENPRVIVEIPELSVFAEGILYSSNNYKSGTVISLVINGKLETRDLPVSEWKIPVGTYTAEIKNDFYGTKKSVNFEIFENRKILLPQE